MLILFDIDGTMLLTGGAGVRAMEETGRELFHAEFTMAGIDFAGRLDSLIWRDLAARNRVDADEDTHQRFRARYGEVLSRTLAASNETRALPGVIELIERLRAMESLTLGVLTGNYPETGRMKIAAAGIDPDVFRVGAWGCEAMSRRDLVPLAMQRYEAHAQRAIERELVVVIGDTPHDVACAVAVGALPVAVATGGFSVEQLRATGAPIVLEDLSDTASFLALLESGARQPQRQEG